MARLEIEQKFRVKNILRLRKKINALEARKQSAGSEINQFWDMEGKLRAEHKALRLRKFQNKSKLTLKGPHLGGKYSKRMELETDIDFSTMQKILKQMGFKKVWEYSKYREEYLVKGGLITIDWLPGFGWFAEIEAPARVITKLMGQLGFLAKDREERTYSQLLREKK